jgi:hypothetical protein
VEIDELTDADALPDGFASASALKGEIQELYADKLQSGYQAYRVLFSVLPPEEQHKERLPAN